MARPLLYSEDGESWIILGENMHRTADGRIVDEADGEGRFLYGPKGMRVKRSEAELLGIVAPAPVKAPAKKAVKKDG